MDIALFGREQPVESFNEGGHQPLSPVGKDSLQARFDHPDSSNNRLKQFSGRSPRIPVSEEPSGRSGIPPLLDNLKHQPQLADKARHKRFQGYCLRLLGFLSRPFRPVLEPHPSCSLQPVLLPGVVRAIGFPNVETHLYHTLDEVEIVVHHLSVAEVIADTLGVGGANVACHMLDCFLMAIVP
jgi:hypothetical protein